jgi:hypothetical protein
MRREAEEEPEPNDALARVLQEWTVPAVPDTLDDRVMAMFQARKSRRPLWRRFFGASIRVPVPVALLALVLMALALWSPRRGGPTPEPPSALGRTAGSLRPSPAQAAADARPGVVRASLAGFELVREMSVTVLPQGATP